MTIPWWKTNIESEERSSLLSAFDDKLFSYGKIAKSFEQELSHYIGAQHTMTTTSGSVALLIASQCLKLKQGDEVLIPNRTFHATAHAPMLSGAKVKLVDCRENSPLICLDDLASKITSKTRAIFVTHLNGRAVEMERVMELAARFDIAVIEDAAQAFASQYQGKYLGTLGDFGCFSFGMTKILSTGQGGLITCNSPDKLEHCQRFISHGVKDTQEDAFNHFGFNFRYCDLLAAIGREQLKKVDAKVAHLRACYSRYLERFKSIELVSNIDVDMASGEVPIWMEVCSPNRDWLMEKLAAKGVDTRRFLPNLEFSDYMHSGNVSLPNSAKFHQQGLFLPFGPGITLDDVDRVCDILDSL